MDLELAKTLVDALPVPALLCTADAIVAVNAEARELIGCDEKKDSVEALLTRSGLLTKIHSSGPREATITSARREFLQATLSKRLLRVGELELCVVVLSSIATRALRDTRRERRALEVCGVGVYEHDYVADAFYGDELLRRMYGFSPDEELTLEAFGSAFHPSDRERVITEILRSRDPEGDGVFDSLIRIVRPDSEVRWIHSRALTEFGEMDGERRPLFCTGSVADVTDQVKLAHALERSEERYVTALQASRIGIYDHDQLADDAADGLYWSPTLLANCGLPLDCKPSRELFQSLVHASDLPAVEEAFRRAYDPAGDGWLEVEHRVVLPSGEVRWSRATSQTYFAEVEGERVAVRTIGAVLDVTENKRREAEWARSSAILDATPDLVSITDNQGRPICLNRAGRKFLNLADGEEPTAERMRASYTESALRRIEEEGISAAIRDGSWKTETEFVDATGQIVPMSQVLIAHEGPEGAVEQFSSIARDLSREKDLEQRYLHAQKMEAVGRLAGGIAHDFNNVLSIITGFTSLAADSVTDAGARRSLDEVLRASDRAAALTAQLLAFSTKQIRQPKVFCLNDTLEDLKPMVSRLLDESIRFEFRPCSPPPFIKADPSQIEQVLLNLAVNARDAMPAGGHLVLETRISEAQLGPAARTQRWVVMAVSDTGHGMDATTQQRIFEPFFSTKAPGKGSGLGLATVFGVVQQSGGDIRVRSQAGEGTTFEIFLPCTEEAPTAPSPPQRYNPVLQRGVKILLVEDDEALRSMAATCLRQAGHEVVVATTPEDALRLAAEHGGTIGLLLTDVVMPQMNGKELSLRVTELVPRIRVLFMSGYTEDAIVHRGVLDRDVNFLPKPFTPEKLMGAVAAAVGLPRSADRTA